MAEEVKPGNEEQVEQGEQKGQDFVNFKAEMGRKFDNTKTELVALKQQNQQVLTALEALATSSAPKKPVVSDEDNEDLMYSDPAKYRKQLKEEILTEAKQDFDTKTATSQTYQTTVYELVNEFPELNLADSEMYKSTMKILDSYPEPQRTDPATMKAASYQAAAALSWQPRSQRKGGSDDDSFSLSASAGGSKSKSRSPSMGPEVVAIASLFGLDTEDKKVMESLEKHTKRDVWNRWR